MPLPLDKHRWSPSPLPGQIVLVTTIGTGGQVDVAPKSWVSMAAFDGPVIGFGCNTSHLTCANLRETGEFVINVVPAALAPQAWRIAGLPAAERVAAGGLTLAPSAAVAPPRVLECVAHLECRHLHTITFGGGEVFIFGTIAAATIDARCLGGDLAAGYRSLDPCFFLQDGLHAPLGRPVAAAGAPDNPATAVVDGP